MIRSTNILGVNISAINYNLAFKEIINWINKRKRGFVCVAAVHLVMECQRNPELLRKVNSAGLITPDGVPLVWLSKYLGNKQVSRVYGPTLMLKLCHIAQNKNIRIFLFGGNVSLLTNLKKTLLKKYPTLQIVGTFDTPTRPLSIKQNRHAINIINKSKAQIVFIGLGCPYQELWMIENRKYLKANVLIGVGAAFDFISGRMKQAPKVFQNIGLEWLFRLAQEPRRLAYRYIILNSLFILKIIPVLFSYFFHSRPPNLVHSH